MVLTNTAAACKLRIMQSSIISRGSEARLLNSGLGAFDNATLESSAASARPS